MPRGRSTDGKPRPEQPRCDTVLGNGHVCSHPQSFHGRDLKRCRALGCTCPKWTPRAVVPVKKVTVKKAPKKAVAAARR